MSRRLLSLDFLKNSHRITMEKFPEMYINFSYFTVGFLGLMYGLYHSSYVEDKRIFRYKRNYTVYRPDDPRVKFYPKHYITDSHLLSKDHPETTIESAKNLPKYYYNRE